MDLKVFRQLKLTGLLDFAVARFYRTENDVISPPGAGNRHVFDLWATTMDHVYIVLNIFLGGNAVMLCHSCYVCVKSTSGCSKNTTDNKIHHFTPAAAALFHKMPPVRRA